MENKNSSAFLKWIVVALFSVLGFGLLSGSANAQDPEPTAGDAQAQQIGDNNAVVEQKTTVKSGDSVAGSQVTGVVGGSPVIQNQNSSDGATATSGDVTAVSTASVNVGPSAVVAAPAPAPVNNVGIASSHTGSDAQAQQIGDNNVVVEQETNISSGDCVAGSQVTGVVGGSPVIQNQNSSDGATCTTGDVVAVSLVSVNVGPSAIVVIPPPPAPVEETELALTKEFVGGTSYWDGDELVYEVTFESTLELVDGPPAETVTFTDPAPAGWTLVSLTTTDPNWTCVGDTCTYTGDGFAGPTTFTAVYEYREPYPAPNAPEQVENTSYATWEDGATASNTACGMRLEHHPSTPPEPWVECGALL